MADYKFDGKELRGRSGKLAVIEGRYLRDAHGHKVGEFDDKYFRDSHGKKLGDFDGKTIRDSRGSKIATLDDVKKKIDGVGGMSLVAMWFFFVR